MNGHTGFHEYKDGKRFNPDCPACKFEELARIRDEKLLDLASIFTQLQILATLPARVV